MHNEFTAIIERDGEWYIAYCPEIPGANGQGKSKEKARASLADAIALILQDRREDGLRAVPAGAIRDTVTLKSSGSRCLGAFACTVVSSNGRGKRDQAESDSTRSARRRVLGGSTLYLRLCNLGRNIRGTAQQPLRGIRGMPVCGCK